MAQQPKTEDIQILKTENYGIFKDMEGNRHLNKAHIERLKRAISTDANVYKFNPVIVNDKMEVVDGQHRLKALAALGFPVYYIKGNNLTLENVQQLNSLTKTWNPRDYAESWVERGNKNYEHYLDFSDRYKINFDVLIRFMALDKPMTKQMFHDGKFKVTNLEKSHDLCQKLIELAPYHDRYKVRPCALAFMQVWSHPKYDHRRMLAKLSEHRTWLKDGGTPIEYIRDFEKIYNHGLPHESKLRFDKAEQ